VKLKNLLQTFVVVMVKQNFVSHLLTSCVCMLLWQDIVRLLRQMQYVTSSSHSRGGRLLQLTITVAAEPEPADSGTVIVSSKPEDHSSIRLPRHVAVAETDSVDDPTKDDDDVDASPWEVRFDPLGDEFRSCHFDDAPLLSGKSCTLESSQGDKVVRVDSELAQLLRSSISLDIPSQELPCRLFC